MSFQYRLNYGNGEVGPTRHSRAAVLADLDADPGEAYIQAQFTPREWRRVDIEALKKGRTMLAMARGQETMDSLEWSSTGTTAASHSTERGYGFRVLEHRDGFTVEISSTEGLFTRSYFSFEDIQRNELRRDADYAPLREALDPNTLEAIAEELGGEGRHSARAEYLRVMARNQRDAILLTVGAPSIACSCRRPNVFRSDYIAEGVRFINRHCITCGSHWHGPAGNVTAYTRAEWDRLLDEAFEAERAATRARTTCRQEAPS